MLSNEGQSLRASIILSPSYYHHHHHHRTCRSDELHDEEVIVDRGRLQAVHAPPPVQQRPAVQHSQRGLLGQLRRL